MMRALANVYVADSKEWTGSYKLRTVESMNYEILTASSFQIEATEEVSERFSICVMNLYEIELGVTEVETICGSEVSVI